VETDLFTSTPWYYTIEVEKGVFTTGRERRNMALTRRLLRNVQVRGIDCIDIGTQEAVVPILLKKAGAGRMVAYDRVDLTRKVEALRTVYQMDFDYVCGFPLHELPTQLQQRGEPSTYDLVVLSGVLYHSINPLGLLALVRGLCRAGGLLLIETAALQNPKELLIFNAGGKVYGPTSNYFIPTTAWLDYVLRMLGLMPLEAIYFGEMQEEGLMRLALLCRSMRGPCPLNPEDSWVFKGFHANAFLSESHLKWTNIESKRGELGYAPYDDDRVLTLSNQSLYQRLRGHPRYVSQKHEGILTLDATM